MGYSAWGHKDSDRTARHLSRKFPSSPDGLGS